MDVLWLGEIRELDKQHIFNGKRTYDFECCFFISNRNQASLFIYLTGKLKKMKLKKDSLKFYSLISGGLEYADCIPRRLIVTWSYDYLQGIIISCLKPFNCVKIICIILELLTWYDI